MFEKEEIIGRKRWRASQAMVNEVWKRWLREYVPDLIERRKWLRPQRNISRRGHWPLGKIINVVPGPDNVVRSAIVKTQQGSSLNQFQNCVFWKSGRKMLSWKKRKKLSPKNLQHRRSQQRCLLKKTGLGMFLMTNHQEYV